ncbi:hypothetical protein J7L48_11540 [bacterium]|nr:hypothetical protein [bacterium]
MKRNFLRYSTLLLVLGLMIFAGCSKSSTDLQTTPDKINKIYGLKGDKTDKKINYVPELIKEMSYESLNENVEILPDKMFLINLVIAGVNDGEINFINCNKGNSFLNMINAVSISHTMSDEKNIKGIISKLENLYEEYEKIPETINPIDKPIISIILGITLEALRGNMPLASEFIINSWEDVRDNIFIDETQSWAGLIIVAAVVLVTIGVVIAIKGACTVGCYKCKQNAALIDGSEEQKAAYDECEKKYSGCNCNK